MNTTEAPPYPLIMSRRRVLGSGLAVTSGVLLQATASAAAGSAGPPALFRERWVIRDGHRIYVRDYPGAAPAFILIHGFPDNSRMYEDLAGRLSAAGRRVIAFDFLGYGASDKPTGLAYTFGQQLADLKAVVDDLAGVAVVPVGHDAGGPAAVNFALDNPGRVAALVLLNCYYANTPVLAFPDFIELCCDPKTRLLARAMMTDPKQAAYLFSFQQSLLRADMTPSVRARFDKVLQPIIAENFTQTPSAMPAFLGMTGDAYANLASNDRRRPELARFDKPVQLIWGADDRYLSPAVAKDLAAQFPRAKLSVLNDAVHWPQCDRPDDVARAMLSAT